jgi:solute carrier family 30 (zinc transporter), member 9
MDKSKFIHHNEMRNCTSKVFQRESTTKSREWQEKILEIKTKTCTLIVRMTGTGPDKVDNIVIEKDEPKRQLSEKEILAEKNKELAKKRIRVNFALSSLERNFITPNRAMSDFLLKASDLETLPKTKRRSPYEQEPPITVYWRKDVESKAIEVWGSRENLLKECLKREIEKKQHQQNVFTMKRRLRDYRREMGSSFTNMSGGVGESGGLFGSSGRVVLTAVAINATNFLFKCFAWIFTGSHSMFAETIHSLADTINQLILAYGIHKSTQVS